LDGAIDTPNPTLQDMAIFADDVRAGASLGFRGKFAIHPRQVAVINELYSPTQDDIARATNIWESFERATANGSAAISVDGEFVDYAIALRAKALLARAAAAGIDVGGGPR
jgi:citrate lyase subunit beta/citryl-CoA lyase